MRRLNEVWNSRQPLLKLPPELLRRIINDSLPWSLDEGSYRYKNPVWRSAARTTVAVLSISHTCRWLRQVVIDDLTLWRSIDIGNRDLFDLVLSRSGTTGPLTLILSPRGNPPRILPTDSFQHLSYLASRLRELHLLSYIRDGSQAPGLKAFLELPLLQLQYFSLTGSERPMIWSGWDGLLPLSGHNAPNLRYLHLETVLMAPLRSPFRRLTHLSLWEITTQSFDTVTDILRNCPALMTLVLRRVTFLIRFFTIQSISHYINTVDPPYLPHLSRVIFVDMEWYSVYFYASLFSHQHPCIQITPRALHQVYPVPALESLYLQCMDTHSHQDVTEADVPRLSIAIHAYEDSSCGTVTGLFITLATSTWLLRITLCPRLLGSSYSELIRGNWRDHALAPLRMLPVLRELWLTDMDTDTDVQPSSLWDFPTPGHRHEPAVKFPALESVVIVYNCSAWLRRRHHEGQGGEIQPSISASPKLRAGDTCPPAPRLGHVRLAIGYDPADLPQLRGIWESAFPGGEGRVDVCAKLLPELASGEYADVQCARLVVQLMPHMVLGKDALEQLRGSFMEVVVEEIDRLPAAPVPERVRDDVLAPQSFIPYSVLC